MERERDNKIRVRYLLMEFLYAYTAINSRERERNGRFALPPWKLLDVARAGSTTLHARA